MGSFWTLPEGLNIMDNLQTVIGTDLFSSFGSSLLYAVCGAAFSVFMVYWQLTV